MVDSTSNFNLAVVFIQLMSHQKVFDITCINRQYRE